MAYGLQLRVDKNMAGGDLIFSTSARNGISTSPAYHFEAINFSSNIIRLSFDNLANHLPSSNLYPACMNFDLLDQNFTPRARNISKPTIVKICDVASYETSADTKIFSSSELEIGTQILANYSSPADIKVVSNTAPIGYSTSKLNGIVNSDYIQKDNFAYVRYCDVKNNFYKYFLLSFFSGSPVWHEIPNDSFYNYVDFYLTLNDPFQGDSLDIGVFQNITISRNQTILINCKSNDLLSGLYSIDNITSTVFLKKGGLFSNHIGQTFFCNTDIDVSSSYNQESSCYYVPYEYGATAAAFSKNLKLAKFINSITEPANYMPIVCDAKDSNNKFISASEFLIPTNAEVNLTRFSDKFVFGINVGEYLRDGTVFDGNINIQIDEGL